MSLGLFEQVAGETGLANLIYERGKFSRSEMAKLDGGIAKMDLVTPEDQPRHLWRGTVSYDNIMVALLAVASKLEIPYHRGKRVVDLERIEKGKRVQLRFQDGTNFTADLVVGADGYMSDVRALLLSIYPPPPDAPITRSGDFHTLPPASRPRYDGLLIYRGLLERATMPEGLYEAVLPNGCGNYNVFYDRKEKLYWLVSIPATLNCRLTLREGAATPSPQTANPRIAAPVSTGSCTSSVITRQWRGISRIGTGSDICTRFRRVPSVPKL